MTVALAAPPLDLGDIQGDVLRAYGNDYLRTSYVFVQVRNAGQGRAWLGGLVDGVINGTPWTTDKPETALNVAMTAAGLRALGLPERLLSSFSQEFQDGMAAHARTLGDTGASAPDQWEAGLGTGAAHVLLIVNALTDAAADERLRRLFDDLGRFDELSVVHEEQARLLPGVREHFGHADGFAQPAIAGISDDRAPGGGVSEHGHWRALAAGEFILGYPDEGTRDDPHHQVLPSAPDDPFGRNGTYMVWRKLAQDVALFRRMLAEESGRVGLDEALLAAKVVGRWRNGTPLIKSPTAPDATFDPQDESANAFAYHDVDPNGMICPIGAHIRRSNPRDSIGGQPRLTFRHRMIRRGMPYGPPLPDGVTEPDGQPRGLIFVCFVASLSRQFESVQVQWVEDGNALGLGRDKDYLLRGPADGTGKMIIQGRPPVFLGPQPTFVTMRGGEYLFLPGLTALGLIADGLVA